MTNNIVLAGRLVDDPVLIDPTKSKIPILNFAIANNRKYKDVETVLFMNVSVYGSYANAIASYLKKGISIEVVGELVQDNYTEEGKNKSRYKIKAHEVDFRETKNKDVL